MPCSFLNILRYLLNLNMLHIAHILVWFSSRDPYFNIKRPSRFTGTEHNLEVTQIFLPTRKNFLNTWNIFEESISAVAFFPRTRRIVWISLDINRRISWTRGIILYQKKRIVQQHGLKRSKENRGKENSELEITSSVMPYTSKMCFHRYHARVIQACQETVCTSVTNGLTSLSGYALTMATVDIWPEDCFIRRLLL